MFDATSLLLGAAISGIGLCLTMLSLWANDREAHFKVNWSIGAGILVVHVFAYWFYTHGAPVSVGAFACALTATLLILGGVAYAMQRREAPLAIGSLALLYLMAGLSFALCGLVILMNRQWSIGYPPQNWAEDLNVVVSVLSISMAGALTLAVDQTRLAKRNQLTAMSDALTGLLNRRGLETAHRGPLQRDDAVVLFDLDHFKQINDLYGHGVGDRVIRTFASTLREHGRATDHKARLGGEEFALVMNDATIPQARHVAERISRAFSGMRMLSEQGKPFVCTVSAGIAFGKEGGASIEDVMNRADAALYAAKRAGRNRVETERAASGPDLRLVG